jgi:hypothetical protein
MPQLKLKIVSPSKHSVAVLDFAVLLPGDAGGNGLCGQGLAKPVAIVAPIAGQEFGIRQGIEHEPCPFVMAQPPFADEQDQRRAACNRNGQKHGQADPPRDSLCVFQSCQT